MGCFMSKRKKAADASPAKEPPIQLDSAERGLPKLVAVVGRTGSGLSQFIHDITQKYEHGIAKADTLRPYTTQIEAITTDIPKLGQVVLIDTPGFDYTKGNTEYDRFDQVVKWTRRRYLTILVALCRVTIFKL
ncbi:hypothetical protein AN958_06553 [Leucoagaricus sp. SymC.cos]|nr:hypothetical protein AN958_06553 [Leucoagaricus sp. SymC.cos]